MGVVYKADDTKLERPVALKFLAAHAIEDPEHKARFVREAKAAARLDHSNICSVYEIDEAEGQTFLAMAYLEGRTVKDKIAERPLKLDEALDIAVQTAQGLQAAHEKDIVHRDIKSANLMVTLQDQVTIMDFGLAQLADRSKLTATTTILGTPSYMSPEQAVGEKTDRRTDLWSLGVVLYEMVVGKLPFGGERQEAVLYGITNEEPETVTALRAGLPMELEWIIGKALAKDREERYQHAEDLLVDLRSLQKKLASGKSTMVRTGLASAVATGTHADPTRPPGQAESPSLLGPLARYRVIEDIEEADDSIKYLAQDTELHRSVAIRVVPQSSAEQIERTQRRKQIVLLGTTALAVLLTLVFAFLAFFSPAPVAEAPVRRFALTTDAAPLRPSISPNGRHIAYLTGSQGGRVLWVQDLDQNQPRSIAGPADVRPLQPSWSPDSKFICFQSRNELKKVSVSGGPIVTLCKLNGPTGRASWAPDGDSIIFSMGTGLHKVPAGGGKPVPWLESQQEGFDALFPAFFSSETGIEKLLYVEFSMGANSPIIALDRTSGQREILAAGFYPVYDPSGHVIYRSNAPPGLWAVPFSVDTMKATGNPFSLAENADDPSVAQDGTLVYLEGPPATGLVRLVWVDRGGNRLGTIGQPQNSIRYPALSPDQKRVAVLGQEGDDSDIWIHDVDRPVKTRLTTEEGNDLWPTWSPAGDRIAFASARTGDRDLYVRRADGSGEASPLLLTQGTAEYMTDWSRDEKTLLFWRRGQKDSGDILYLKRKDDGSYEDVAFQTTGFEETTPQFSPDERFIAYTSDESGEREIYIQAFPQGGNKRVVSVNGGTAPRWRADGKELFYVEGDTLMATPVSTSPALTLGTPEALFSAPGLAWGGANFLGYDVTPEGNKFVIWERVEADTKSQPVIRVVENWYEEFREQEQD